MVRSVEEMGVDVPTQKELLELVRNISDPQHRALIVLAYLTGGRVREVLSLVRKQLRTEDKNGRRVLAIYHMKNEKSKKRKTLFLLIKRVI
jgi:integrase